MNIKNTAIYKKILVFISIGFIFSVIPVFAQNAPVCNQQTGIDSNGKPCYVELQPGAFPGVTENSSNLGGFLGSVFNWGIALAVVLALIMIIFGGIEMMTSDSWTKHDDGRKKINDALLGLGLALISWLLLYIINPSLVLFNGNLLLNPTQNSQQTTTSPAPSTATGPFPNQ